MKIQRILKIFLFLAWFTTILQPADATLDIVFGYMLSYVVEYIFGFISPVIKYAIGGPPVIVRDALTAATPILNLSLFGENGTWIAFSIVSSIVETLFTFVWWLITTVASILVSILTGDIYDNAIWKKLIKVLSWIAVGFSQIGSFFGTTIAGERYRKFCFFYIIKYKYKNSYIIS